VEEIWCKWPEWGVKFLKICSESRKSNAAWIYILQESMYLPFELYVLVFNFVLNNWTNDKMTLIGIEQVICFAVEQDIAALQFLEKQTTEICMLAMKKDRDAIKYIRNPTIQMYGFYYHRSTIQTLEDPKAIAK